jgi:DNA-binding Xre family transcriptional regulator
MTAQIIRKDGLPEYAIVPWEQYETLLRKAEALDDAAAFDRAVREMEEVGDEVISAEIVNRLLAGETPVRVWREHRGLTQSELATRSGLSQSYIAMLERGTRRGTTEKLQRLARALELDPEDLLPASRETEGKADS